jgi:flagellar hook-associated protein 2
MALVQFTGLASGIDSAALIEALIDQERKARVDPLEDKITEYQDQNDALTELKSLMDTLKTAASNFRLINGGGIAKEATSSDETVVTATASNSASPGYQSLTVNQLATNGILSFDDRFNSTDSKIYAGMNDGDTEANRTVSVDIGTGASQESVNIVLTSSSTVSDFINEFNNTSSMATASAVNMGTAASPSYAIMITSNETGEAEGTVAVSVGAAITPGAFSATTVDQATNAEFSIDGISGTITRASNTISDVVTGVSFKLEETGSATVGIGSDAATTTSTIQEFIDAYNDVVEFIKENDTVEREENGDEVNNIFGPLAKTSLDDNILTSLRSALTSAGISGGEINILAELGITSERDGTLKFDSEIFESALIEDPESVSSILENMGENLAATDGTIAQFIRFNGLIDSSVKESEGQISLLTDQIADAEKRLSQQEEQLTARYARLEKLMAEMQNQQNTLVSLLPQA